MFEGLKNVFGGGNKEEVKPIEEHVEGVVRNTAEQQEARQENEIVYENVKDKILEILLTTKIKEVPLSLKDVGDSVWMNLVLEKLQEEGLVPAGSLRIPVIESDWKKTILRVAGEKLDAEDEERHAAKIA